MSTLKDLQDIKGCDGIVLVTDHSAFTGMDIDLLKSIKVFVDGRNCMDSKKIKALGVIYKGIDF